MTTVAAPLKLNLSDLLDQLDIRPFRRDPLGLVSGFKAYQLYSQLDGKSDGELAALGLTRADLPSFAMNTAFNLRG